MSQDERLLLQKQKGWGTLCGCGTDGGGWQGRLKVATEVPASAAGLLWRDMASVYMYIYLHRALKNTKDNPR